MTCLRCQHVTLKGHPSRERARSCASASRFTAHAESTVNQLNQLKPIDLHSVPRKRVGTRDKKQVATASEEGAVVVGAGLAGLSCTLALEEAGLRVRLLEAEDAPGGRVRTDIVEGFRLDRGFQVLLTAYPDAKRLLNYRELDLKRFGPGALVWQGGKFHRFADPFRAPFRASALLFDSVVPLSDKMRLAKLRARVRKGSYEEIFGQRETTTREHLQAFGFTDAIIERFFAPLFSGMFLERELVTSNRLFEFLFRIFSAGDAAIPAGGMEQIPRQLASRLRPGTLQTGARVRKITRTAASFEVEVQQRETVAAQAVVLATAGDEGNALLTGVGGWSVPEVQTWNKTTTLYYAAERNALAKLLPEREEPWVLLNGEGVAAGPVNHLAVVSAVAPGYAPRRASLLAVSVVGEAPGEYRALARMDVTVRRHLSQWFGPEVDRWKTLAAYPVARALPLQRHAEWEHSPVRLAGSPGVYICGDYRETASIQGALASGRRAAAAVVHDLRGG